MVSCENSFQFASERSGNSFPEIKVVSGFIELAIILEPTGYAYVASVVAFPGSKVLESWSKSSMLNVAF